MPIQIMITTTAELFDTAIRECRALSDKILKLADLEASPLSPGESPDARRHQIAKLAKQLAQTFVALDTLMRDVADAHVQSSDVTAGPVGKSEKPDIDPNAN